MAREPIFLTPRMLPRRWGRDQLGAWCETTPRPAARIGEIWSCQAANKTDDGGALGERIQSDPSDMLGDLGRAPPLVRLMLAGEPSDPIVHQPPLAFMHIAESPLDGAITLSERGRRSRRLRCKRGDLFRFDDAFTYGLDAGVTALEVRPSFTPENSTTRSQTIRRLTSVSERNARQVWLRDTPLSVELWTLPETSVIAPDGETCHVLTALTPGVTIAGKPLARGQSVFVPAQGASATINGQGAQLMVSYPDLVPTKIWRYRPDPGPRPNALLKPARLTNDAVIAHPAYALPILTLPDVRAA